MTTREDLDETVNLVEKTGRRIVAAQGDVRDFQSLRTAVATAWRNSADSTSYSPTPGSCRRSANSVMTSLPTSIR